MRALRLKSYEAANGLSLDTVEKPAVLADQLLVRVRSAGINPIDWKVRYGALRTFMPFDLPITLGGDISGEVIDIGSGVDGFSLGDTVNGMTDTCLRYAHGAFAEFVAVTARNVTHVPCGLTHAQASVVPLAALTAWQGLFDEGELTCGQRVLIHAAAGGVGGFAVQFARAIGAYVIGTSSAANLAYLNSLGAHEAVDYNSGPFEEQIRNVDLVLDLLGGDVQVRSFKTLRPGGTLVNAWGALATPADDSARLTVKKVAVTANGIQLRLINDMIESGLVKVTISREYALKEADAAFNESRSGHVRGKIVFNLDLD